MANAEGPMSGFRDLLADQMIPREEVLSTIRAVYEDYGFVPLKTPALERLETMSGKYGDEGEKLMYKFQDNGGRDVAMRYDQTVPLARVVAQHGNELPMPYKRYALGEVWRGESPQAGRYREFTQFDADTVGSGSFLADTEIIAMIASAMTALEVNALIRVNDRGLLDALAQRCGLTEESDFRRLVGQIDKIDKIGRSAVKSEIASLFGEDISVTTDAFVAVQGTTEERLVSIFNLLGEDLAGKGIDNIRKIMGTLSLSGISESQVVFDPTIARGLDYYTSTIYETTLVDLPEIGSVCSGGRYDKLIESLGGPDLPAVGTSIGVDRLIEAMRQLDKLRTAKTNTKVFVANLEEGLQAECFALTQRLRSAGVAAEMYLDSGDRLKKQLRSVDRLGVRFVLLYGSAEKNSKKIQLKDLQTGTQEEIDIDKFSSEILVLTQAL